MCDNNNLESCEICNFLLSDLPNAARHKTKCETYGGPVDMRKKNFFEIAKEQSMQEQGDYKKTYEKMQILINTPKLAKKPGPKATVKVMVPNSPPNITNNIQNIQNIQNVNNVINNKQTNNQNVNFNFNGQTVFNIRVNDVTTPQLDYVKGILLDLAREIMNLHKMHQQGEIDSIDDDDDDDNINDVQYYGDDKPWIREQCLLLSKFHKEIYHNPNHPENHSIRAKRKNYVKRNAVELSYCDKGEWKKIGNKQNFYREIQDLHLRQICRMMEEVVEEMTTDVNDKIVPSSDHKEVAEWYLNQNETRKALFSRTLSKNDPLYDTKMNYADWYNRSREKMEQDDETEGQREVSIFKEYWKNEPTDAEHSIHVRKLLADSQARREKQKQIALGSAPLQ